MELHLRDLFLVPPLSFCVGIMGAAIAWFSFGRGQRAERRRVRRLLRGSVRLRSYEPRLLDDEQQPLNAVAVQVTETGGYQFVFTGDRTLVAEAMRAAAESVSPLPL
jgi:hypothetical protein